MDLTGWVLYALLTLAVLTGAVLHYRRHEPFGRGRYVLAGLRGASVALVLLLVFDPVVPAWLSPADEPTVALIDASLSMRLRAPDGATRWDEARREVAALDPDHILLFGTGPARVVRSLDDARPDQSTTRLAPALAPALEAARGRVVVITDGAVEDMAAAAGAIRGSVGRLEVRRVGERTAGNLGLVELTVPAWSSGDAPVEVTVGVARVGDGLPDSTTVTLWWGDRELGRVGMAVPPEGRASTATMRFTPPAGMEGPVRLDARLEHTDAEPADDRRSAYLRVADRPAGVVLVSFRADQEPRFLLPVLERAAGIPARGWLALTGNRYVRLGVGADAGRTEDEAAVRRAADAADLLVLHGLDDDAPVWARSAAATAPRVLLFPRGPVADVPLAIGPSAAGDWYPVAELPPSPMAAFLAAADMGGAPPVTRLHVVEPPPGWWTPLHVRQDRRGTAHPTLLGRDIGDRRSAVALAEGYWRWAFAEQAGRDLYDAYWAGVVAWLMEAPHDRQVDVVRPDDPVVPRGAPLRWAVPRTADSLRVTLHPLPAEVAEGRSEAGPDTMRSAAPLDTVLTAVGGSAVQRSPAYGHYRYEARAFLEPGETADGTGELTVERYSPEFTHPGRTIDLGVDDPADTPFAAGPARPLRALAWPYLVLVALLCAEWVLRRRWGLR